MSKTRKGSRKSRKIVEFIVTRFINLEKGYTVDQFDSIAEILDLPISALKGLTDDDVSAYEELFSAQCIRDMTKLYYENPFRNLIPEQYTDNPDLHKIQVENIITEAKHRLHNDLDKLRGTILVANMISRSWQKRNEYLKKKDTKVITIGLDNAGKTAILTALGGKLGVDTLSSLKPTKKVERRRISTNNLDLFIWDFGGQEEYRDLYIQQPEKYFLRTDMIIYVVDMQDPDRYTISFEYFYHILDIITRLGEKPYVLCYMHKSDPELLEEPDFEIHLEYVKEQLKLLLDRYSFDYDIYKTSIFNFFSSEPKFSKYIKEVMRDHQSFVDPTFQKIESVGKILENTMNSVINLASSVGEQILSINNQMLNIDDRLARMEKALLIDSEKIQRIKPLETTLPPITVPSLRRPIAAPPVDTTVFKEISEEMKAAVEEGKEELAAGDTREQLRMDALKDLRDLFNKSGVVIKTERK